MKKTLLSASLMALLSGGVNAATYTLDFDGPGFDSTNAQSISNPNTFTDDGITWEIATSGGLGGAIFDTTCTGYGGSDGCNGDADLQPLSGTGDVSGNVLIQQRNSVPTPNDDADTDWITLTLKSDVALVWKEVSAVDDGGYVFSTNKDGELGFIAIVGDSEQGKTSFQSSILTMGDVITVDFRGVTNPAA